MSLRLLTAPDDEPITLAQAKAHLRQSSTDDDAYIRLAIVAAREAAEHKTGRSLLPQTWRLTFDAFPPCARQWRYPVYSSSILLLKPPVTGVTTVKYLAAGGDGSTLATLDDALYVVDTESEPGRLCPAYGQTWPQTYPTLNAVQIDYATGYEDADSVPQQIKQWMLLRLGAMYENREEVLADSRAAVVAMPFMDSLLERAWVVEKA